MQLRSRNITAQISEASSAQPRCTRAVSKTKVTTTRTPKTHRQQEEVSGGQPDDCVAQMSENGVRHAMLFADKLMETKNTSLHAHFVADGRRLFKRLQDSVYTTRGGGNSKRVRQDEFDRFVRFVLDESGVDITEDVNK
jgi:hypothetical protein